MCKEMPFQTNMDLLRNFILPGNAVLGLLLYGIAILLEFGCNTAKANLPTCVMYLFL